MRTVKFLFTPIRPSRSVEISSMSISQSVECPLTLKDTMVVGGNLDTRNGIGQGMFSIMWRRLISTKGWSEVLLQICSGVDFVDWCHLIICMIWQCIFIKSVSRIHGKAPGNVAVIIIETFFISLWFVYSFSSMWGIDLNCFEQDWIIFFYIGQTHQVTLFIHLE